MNKYLTLGSIIIFFGCVPPADESPSADVFAYEGLDDCDPCNVLSSFATSNYQNQDWRGAVDNYNTLLKCNCGKLDPENTYKYMAYSYQHLGLYDSAGYIFNQGLKYTPEDIDLLRMAGENSGRLKNYDNQIYYFDKILSIEENDLEVLELLSNVYRDQEMFEEQIGVLNIWLKYEPSSKNANSYKRSAFEALGKDISDVDKERWESESSNIQYGIDYIEALKIAGDNEKIIEVSNELLIYDRFNRQVLHNLAETYQNIYNEDSALEIYQTLIKIDPTNYKVALEISEILISKEQFKDALMWAEKAISISGKKGEAVYQRAEVYFEIAENCSANENEMSHWTRAVYEFSWQDYMAAYNMGYKQALSRKLWLEEGKIITQIGTWFQLEPNIEIKLSACPLDCYSWIDKTLKKRNL